jgi:hypothetical protein
VTIPPFKRRAPPRVLDLAHFILQYVSVFNLLFLPSFDNISTSVKFSSGVGKYTIEFLLLFRHLISFLMDLQSGKIQDRNCHPLAPNLPSISAPLI